MIRPASVADIPDLIVLEQVFPTDRMSGRNFRDLLRRGHAGVLVYEDAGRVAGAAVVLYRRNTRRARIYSLVVDPAQRGRGIARQLLAAVEQDARARHCEALQLEVRPDNVPALHLYQQLGYAILQQVADFYEDGSPALRLGKTL